MSDQAPYQLDIRVTVTRPNSWSGSSDRFTVDENMTVPASTFMEVAAILGQFHELAEKIRTEKETP